MLSIHVLVLNLFLYFIVILFSFMIIFILILYRFLILNNCLLLMNI